MKDNQNKRDIKKTILYINEAALYIAMQKDAMDGEPSWKQNVIESCATAIELLSNIEREQ